MSFERKVTLTETAIGGPALANLGDTRLGLAWVGNEAAQRLNVATSVEGRLFDGKVILGEAAIDSPALTFGGGRAWLGWTAKEATQRLNVISSPDLSQWSFTPKVTLAQSSPYGPALAYAMNLLFIAWADLDQRLHIPAIWDSDSHGADHWFAKFCPPTVANGRVYLATFEDPAQQPAPNALEVWGLP